MGKSAVFMFSGQGSQYYQMGRELFEHHPVFRTWMLRLNDVVVDLIGESVVDQVYGRRSVEQFNRTLYSHPAIFTVEYALAQVLLQSGIEPDHVLGASLGEFTSSALAGVMEVEEALEAVVKQAESFEASCEKGGMLAILHDAGLYDETPVIHDNCELASVNFDSHFVVSGKTEKLKDIERFLKSENILCQSLPVSYGFHSSSIDPAASAYKHFLSQKTYQRPSIPLVSCLSGNPITDVPQDFFWDVVRKPMQFPRAVRELENGQDRIYLDLGPGGTLANFAKRNLREDSRSESHAVMTPFHQDLKNVERIKGLFPTKRSFFVERKVKNMMTFVFPGQGSQHKGMGGPLFDEFRELTARADDILGYSVKRLCTEDPHQQLGQTQYTQTALYTVNALSYLRKIKETGRKPDYLSGHSLGEYNALFAAGAFDFATGLRLVKKRGELMSQASGGGMAAVIGLSVEKIEEVLKKQGITNVTVANYNSPSQIVIAGYRTEIESIRPFFEEAGGRYIPLNVSGAFHSRHMSEAKKQFENFLDAFTFLKLMTPVISNVNARPYKQEDIKKNLIEQITHPVKWTESICYLMGKGEMAFEEIGPGNILSRLIQTIKKEATPLVMLDAEEALPQQTEGQREAKPAQQQEVPAAVNDRGETGRGNGKKTVPAGTIGISAASLGDPEFKKDYNLKYAYLTGSMYRGISSKEMVVKIAKAGMMGFFGTGGITLPEIEKTIQAIRNELSNGHAYGLNLLHNPGDPKMEEETVDLFLKYKVRTIEASAYMGITPSLVRYRAYGLKRDASGAVVAPNQLIAKVSRPEVAEAFLSPAPTRIAEKLVQDGKITREQAELLKEIPMANDISVEADSGGHTDGGVAYALMPAMIKLRDEMMIKHGYIKRVRIGAAGGIGAPEAAAAAFIMGADFILTGSINQCTVEAGTSDQAKDMLQQVNVQDTEYAPAGDMFELGAKVQVVKKGVFFPARANKLYDLYRHYNSLDEIDEKTKLQIQEKYFKKSFEEIYIDSKSYYSAQEIEKAERSPKQKMALIFKWYFGYTTRLALSGNEACKVDYQVHCGPALGAFNQWVKGTRLENWKNRHVDEIAVTLMDETAKLLNRRYSSFLKSSHDVPGDERKYL